MKQTRTLLVYVLLASAVIAAAAFIVTQSGMIQRHVSVSGTVTRDGKPLEWKSDAGTLSVVFLPKQRDNTTEVFRANSDRTTGRFEIKELPTGTYIVCVQQLDPDGAHDLLGMVYDPSSTDIERDVKSDGQQIDIDLPKVLPKRRTAPPRMPAGRPANPPPRTDGDAKKDEPKKDEPKKDAAEKKSGSK